MQIDVVQKGYDQIADTYLTLRKGLKSDKYIQQLLNYLPKRSIVLDVGCGAGIPVDDILLKAGHHVIGLDISDQQILRARKLCPGGEYLVRDVRTLSQGEFQVQAIVCLYTLFHIPRSEHARILGTFASYVPRGGMVLMSMGDVAFEGPHFMYGAPMWSSQYGTARNLEIVATAGFEVVLNAIDTSGGERHQILMGQKL